MSQDQRAYQRAYRAARKSKGLCIKCKQRALADRVHCESHAQDDNRRQADRYEERKARGVCPRCKNESRPGQVLCEACRLAQRAKRRGQAAASQASRERTRKRAG